MSPILQAKIAQQNTAPKPLTKNLPQTKNDTVELSKKFKMPKNKKLLIALASAIGAIAVGVGAIALIDKGKAAAIQNKGKKIQQTAKKVQTYAQTAIDEVLTNLDKVKTAADGSKTLEELAQDGKTLVRKSTLCGDGFLTVDDFLEKARIEAQDGILTGFHSDFEVFDDGSVKSKESFNFVDNKLRIWVKNFYSNPDGSSGADKGMYFENEKVSGLIKKLFVSSDGEKTYKKAIGFGIDGKIIK